MDEFGAGYAVWLRLIIPWVFRRNGSIQFNDSLSRPIRFIRKCDESFQCLLSPRLLIRPTKCLMPQSPVLNLSFPYMAIQLSFYGASWRSWVFYDLRLRGSQATASEKQWRRKIMDSGTILTHTEYCSKWGLCFQCGYCFINDFEIMYLVDSIFYNVVVRWNYLVV